MQPAPAAVTRVIVVPIIRNHKDEYLLVKMAADRGVFPGQWGLPGGGIEPGEDMTTALRREVREELDLELDSIEPLFFSDGAYQKLHRDGRRVPTYMVFLIFSCRAAQDQVRIGEEFSEYAWAPAERLAGFDLNAATQLTFRRLKLIPG